MITKEFEFLSPVSSGEAVEVLAERGEEVTILAGGMSLLPMMNLGIVRPAVVMSLNHVTNMARVSDSGELRVGATVRHREVSVNQVIAAHAPMLAEAAKSIGDVQVRNRGTIGGSFSHADPSADYLPVSVVYGVEIELASSTGTRRLQISEFLIDVMFTSRAPNELVTAIIVPEQNHGRGWGYSRLSRVEGSFPIVNAAALVDRHFSEAKVGIGGVGPTPVLVDASDAFRDGPSPGAFDALSELAFDAASSATSDVHSDAEYRRNMASVFAQRAFKQALERLETE